MKTATTITKIEGWVVRAPLLNEWVASPEFGEFGAEQNRFLLRVSDGDGFEGWGESGSVPSEALLKQTAGELLGSPLADLRPSFLELWPQGSQYWQRPLPPSPYTPTLANLQHRLRHPLQSLVESALTDLTAKRAGVPFHHLLGGAWRDRVLTDYWMGETTPEHAQRCVKRGMKLGFHGIKLKAKLEDPNVERLEAIRDVAPDWKVTVDPNGRFYRLEDALPTIRAMDAVGNLATLEDPFPRFHLEQFAALRSRINARVVVHLDPLESLWAVLQSGAAGGLNIDSAEGLFKWRMQAAVVEQANLTLWHGSGLDLGVLTATQLHLAASAPNCQLPGDQIGPWLRECHLLKQDFVVENGHVLVPRGTGLGVEVDFDKLEKYTVRKFN